MIDVRTIQCNMLQENCYVVFDTDTREAVVIDPGAYYPEEHQAIARLIADKRLDVKHILCTHGHFDHCFGGAALCKLCSIGITIHKNDVAMVTNLSNQVKHIIGITMNLASPPIEKEITDGDEICFGNHKLKVIHTPGHSSGCVVFYDEADHMAFTGDTLFRMSIGRTDFPESSHEDMLSSLHRLSKTLAPDTKLYPGHGPGSIMSEELAYNPYLG